ncbi:sugar transferase [Ruania suaedae]|uniref:sugar transferase n=1 Tax=Ruania suaedae TaxID=2897774 RepID=UPI001E2E5CDF|nr:sugar transferase [Ruania suaedae]UFU02406.1 sugar transferase [Ruania suaedae]
MIAALMIAIAMRSSVASVGLLIGGPTGAGLVFAAAIAMVHGYDSRRAMMGSDRYRGVLRAGWAWASLLIGLAFLGSVEVPPVPLVAAIAGTLAAVVLSRRVQLALLRRRRRRGHSLRRTLLVGAPGQLDPLVDLFRSDPELGFEIIGASLPAAPARDGDWRGAPVLGTLERVTDIVVEHGISTVVVAAGTVSAVELRRLCWQLERHHIELVVAPHMDDVVRERVRLHSVGGTPLLTVDIGAGRPRRAAKSVLDRTLGVVLFVMALPVLAISAVLVRASSPGPAFYRQTRTGLDGAPFTMIKLRTMHVDADRARAALLASSEGNAVLFKMREDPRVTPVGRLLRRMSIDELPQLWNVVRGDMSLVGPRPPLGEEVATYDHDAIQRLRVKPGLTGLWQVSGRSDLSWAQSLRLDLRYVDNWSVMMDLTILWRTVRAVLGGRGAY